MSDFIWMFVTFVILTIPILLTIFIIRCLMRKKSPKLGIALIVCLCSIIPLMILGILTDPATWCDHKYEIKSETPPTCTSEGEIEKVCSLCEKEDFEYIDKLGHDMQDISRVEPTQSTEGSLVRKCSRCSYQVTQSIDKLSSDSQISSDPNNDWKTTFTKHGFTETEISSYEEMLLTVGITEFHDVDIVENGVMHIVRGKIFDSSNLQLNVTMENRKIFLIELAGIPAEKTEAYINWRGKIKFKTVDTTKSVDLYYDMDGGYIAKLDWDSNTILPIE